jgi:isoleucyl-tRNA synthetase
VGDFISLTERAGVWIDTDDAYWTLDNTYIESVWWLLRQLWDKGLLYEGHRVTPYCARCGTALSSHELGQPGAYRDITDPSVFVRFPLTDGAPQAFAGADLLVWTTTPWTLVSNVAAAVGPDIAYVRVPAEAYGRTGNDLIVAEGLAPEGAEVRARANGSELVGARYTRPFDFLDVDPSAAAAGRPWRVVAAEFVSTDDGSGIVHLAPAFGEDDAQVGRAEGLPVLNPVTAEGTFDDRIGPWAGRFVKDADPAIVTELGARGLLVREQAYEHSYPHCWRCSTPLIYWAKTSWFVRTSEQRQLLIDQNQTIGWHPENIKNGRFGKWLENNIDWALSRDRYWGTPLPVWRCDGCGRDHCIGSVAELAERTGRDLADLDLHRPYVDDVTFACTEPGCTGTFHRHAAVLDAWFDSGSMPAAQFHYPFENTDAFESLFPADFICEAIDQTRGWFYSLLAVNSLVFGTTPYRNVVCLNLVVDEQGQKMSKSKGNVIDPWEMFDRVGADAVRWTFFSQGQPWTPRRVYEEGVREATRQSLLTLWNCYSFFATYADLDGWTPQAERRPVTHVLDRWILSELDATVRTATDGLDDFDAFGAATAIAAFIDDLSNWYVRRSRPRFWKSSDPAAHQTLHECLVTVSELLAPFCPFLADELHTTLTGSASVHLADWPTDHGRHDPALADGMATVRRLVTLGRSARTDAKAKVRQPLRRALVLHPGGALTDELAAEVRAELNVKALEGIDTLSGLMSWNVVPNFRALGPRLGPKVAEVKAALAAADGSALQAELEASGSIEVAGERLSADEVEVRAERHEAFALAEEEGWAVALDLELTDDLRAEGHARELVRVLNDQRKAQGFAIADRVAVVLSVPAELEPTLRAHGDYLVAEVLATVVELTTDPIDDAVAVEVDGHAVGVVLTLASSV